MAGGELRVPDAGVTYTLYDNDGAPVAGHNNVAINPGAVTTYPLVLPGAANMLGGTDFESRTLTVNYAVGGAPYQFRESYRIGPFVHFVADPKFVRTLVGLAPVELPDEDLDLTMAYFLVAEDVDRDVLDEALAAGVSVSLWANRAIAWRSLIEIVPSLPLRALASEESKSASVSRFRTVSVAELTNQIFNGYIQALSEIRTVYSLPVPTVTLPTIFIVARDTDPITGV